MIQKALKRLQKSLNRWSNEYVELTTELYTLGDKSSSIEYNILSARALELSECSDDVRTMMLNHVLGISDD